VRAGPPMCDLPLKARIGTHAEPADCAVAKREEGKDMEETARKERLAGQRVIPVLVDCLVLYRKHAKQASQLKDRTTSSTNAPRHDLSDKEIAIVYHKEPSMRSPRDNMSQFFTATLLNLGEHGMKTYRKDGVDHEVVIDRRRLHRHGVVGYSSSICSDSSVGC